MTATLPLPTSGELLGRQPHDIRGQHAGEADRSIRGGCVACRIDDGGERRGAATASTRAASSMFGAGMR